MDRASLDKDSKAMAYLMQSPKTERVTVNRRAPQLALCGAAMLCPLSALACSGPGAAAAIADSFRIALLSLAITVGWFLAALIVPALRRRVGKKGLLLLGATCVFHPALLAPGPHAGSPRHETATSAEV